MMTLELRYILVHSNYVLKLRYKWSFLVTFVCNQKMTKNYIIIT